MPELPEVETVMRGLEPHMVGSLIVKAEQRRENLRFPFPEKFVSRLQNQQVQQMRRRAKYIVVSLSSGEELIMHLGMSGRFTVNSGEGAPLNEAHDHVLFHLSNGDVVRYNDPRRFGFMDLIKQEELPEHKFFSQLGPEPLGNEFDEILLAEKALGKKTPLKNFLLDQRVVAGLGNIYVLEALHMAGLSPMRPSNYLATKKGKPLARTGELVKAIRLVLGRAIEAGGSTLKDYAKADGSLGYFQHSFQVYGRAGEACLKKGCTGTIERVVQGGRSSFFCRRCQK